MNLIQELEKEQFDKLSAGKTIPEFGPGDTVILNVKVVEGERSRVQAYEGVCIGRSGGGLNESFTVRKISYGEGVERVFPVMSPMIDFHHWWCAAARCAVPSSITCATCAASRPASSRRSRIGPRSRIAPPRPASNNLLSSNLTKSAGSPPRFIVAAPLYRRPWRRIDRLSQPRGLPRQK